MSGIAGIIQFDGASINQEVIQRMLKPLKHRGPHETSLYVEDKVGLGLTLLDVSPQSNSEAPSHRLPITFDGRLDNRLELTEKLRLVNPILSDAELILASYEKWGRDCVKHLLGDFAFALWDRSTKTLFCARDHFGVKPFYYYYSRKYFIFASSPYAILAAQPELLEINEARVADFLVGYEGIDETNTFYVRIFRLPRRNFAVIDDQGMKITAYWDLQPTTNNYQTEKDYVEAFHEIFSVAVQCRLGVSSRTFVPLSGGMDSTSIAAVAREIYSQKDVSLNTLSAISINENNSEAKRIQSVLAQGGICGGMVSEKYIKSHIDSLISDLAEADEPFDAFENSWRPLYRQAQKKGIHISLDGIDGDLMFAGSNYLKILWKAGDYRAFLGETLFAGGLTNVYYKNSFVLFLLSLRSVLTPDWLRVLFHEYTDQTFLSRLEKSSLIGQELAQNVKMIERKKLFSSYDTRTANSTLIESHKKSIFHPHLQAALERYDRIAAAFSIESRHPFFDVRLVEFCLNLPWQLRTSRGWNKTLLREDMKALLPSVVVQSKEKKHPAWRFSIQILNIKKDYFQELLNDELENLKPYVNTRNVNRAWHDFSTRGNSEAVPEIWYAIGLALWLRRQREVSV